MAQIHYNAPPVPPSRFEGVNPVGRVDIAAVRVLQLLGCVYLDPIFAQAVVPYCMPYVETAAEMLIGPKTKLGRQSVVAVAAVRAFKGLLDASQTPGVNNTPGVSR